MMGTDEVFKLINEIFTLTIDCVSVLKPYLVKNIGDAALMIFDVNSADRVILNMLSLKSKLENYLEDRGFKTRSSFSCHVGEAAIGQIGKEPFKTTDAFGDAINTTFIMNSRPSRGGSPFSGRLNISPQLFRKLSSETRKRFHKYTPQIVYIAD